MNRNYVFEILTFASILGMVSSQKCSADMKAIKNSKNEPINGFSRVHFEVDIEAIEKEIQNEKRYILDLQGYCLKPPALSLCEFLRGNTTTYNGKINYILSLCNSDIDMRKRQYFGLQSALAHVLRAEKKFNKYVGVLKNQIEPPNDPSYKPDQKDFQIISHPVMKEEVSNQDDAMAQEIDRLMQTGGNILKSVEEEDFLKLTKILLSEMVHIFELFFSPNVSPSPENEEISYIMSGMQLNTHLTEISNNASLMNILITDLTPILDLSKTRMDEEMFSPGLLNCVIDEENGNLKQYGYKIGTSSKDWYKPNQIGFVRSLSTDKKKLVITMLFKIIQESLPLLKIPDEVKNGAENYLEYLTEG